MANPTIDELQNSGQYELIARMNHRQIKEFVIEQLSGGGKMVTLYTIYQVVLVLVGLFFFTRSIVLFFHDYHQPFFYSLAALVFSFSVLIVIHELLHGAALKIAGAKKVNFGGYFKKFIFYAEADRFVLNRKQFSLVALTPFVVIKLVSLVGIVVFLHSPLLYFFIFLMSAHSLFCAGDVGLLSVFYKYPDQEIFTFDVNEEKTSYYYLKKE